ncbi:MAG TPA: hypothetical protein VK726_12385 [Acetobacteraceae bacterium]|nr:hypothetical protein [Acetobacteraceae bacterium]
MKRLACLDGLRGVLRFYGLITHMAPFAPPRSGISTTAPDPFLVAQAARSFPVLLPVFAVAVGWLAQYGFVRQGHEFAEDISAGTACQAIRVSA